jgi:hypothetical protein
MAGDTPAVAGSVAGQASRWTRRIAKAIGSTTVWWFRT